MPKIKAGSGKSTFDTIVLGQGLAGSAVAWTFHKAGKRVAILDSRDRSSASRVAAGLLTPLTGKRVLQSPTYKSDWEAAKAFYRSVEELCGTSFFIEAPMLRFLDDDSLTNDRCEELCNDNPNEFSSWSGPIQKKGLPHAGIKMSPAGRLSVAAYLDATEDFFSKTGGYFQVNLRDRSTFVIHKDSIEVPEVDITAKEIVLCTGARSNPLFPNIPNNPCGGDVLTVKIEGYSRDEVCHRGIWIAPNKNGTQDVGATYHWDDLSAKPNPKGRQELVDKLRELVVGDMDIFDHRAGVRPAMKDRNPALGRHPIHKNAYILNGLGSKGTLLAPVLAAKLWQVVEKEQQPSPEHDARRLLPKTISAASVSLTTQAQNAVADVVRSGDTVIDATMGNGFDTAFLCEVVTKSGRVLAFDIQPQAILATKQRLTTLRSLSPNAADAQFFKESHEHLRRHTEKDTASAVMFNLGYLPKSDGRIITKVSTTVAAIGAAMEALKNGGVLTVIAYRGHPGGEEEYSAVKNLLGSLAAVHELRTVEPDFRPSSKKIPPVLFILKKRSGGDFCCDSK